MGEGIVEDDQRHPLGGVFIVVNYELIHRNLLDVLVGGAGLVDERGFANEFTIFVDLIFAHEVGELELGEELGVLKTEGVLELLFGDSVENILEDLLIRVVDQLVHESTLALVTPQTDEEQAGVFHILQVGAILDDLELTGLGHTGHTTEDTSQFADSEHVMELGGRGKQLGGRAFPELNGSLD